MATRMQVATDPPSAQRRFYTGILAATGGGHHVVAPEGQLRRDVLVRADVPCNLSFDHGATYDYCRVTLAFNIKEGDVEGTDIAGRQVVLIADTPKVMTEGNWKLGVFIDDGASDEQFDKLVKVFSGQIGGPMGALASLVGENRGVERAAIEIGDDGLTHRVKVGDLIDFEIQDIVPFGIETGEPVRFNGMFRPVGSDLTMAEAKRTRINAFGITYEGKTGLSKSDFSWVA